MSRILFVKIIIPYQELPGNYNFIAGGTKLIFIIPYQELPGNYNLRVALQVIGRNYTIPRTTRELQHKQVFFEDFLYYTIPRTTRELQRLILSRFCWGYYTIPRTTRELQLPALCPTLKCHYTIPRTTRELQHVRQRQQTGHGLYHTKNYQGTTTITVLVRPPDGIIPYQELPGNYNWSGAASATGRIIPYQELPGNYNTLKCDETRARIIPYQELPGNYNILQPL